MTRPGIGHGAPGRSRQGGFTLMEVMVALAIVAIALAAIIKGSSEMTANAAYLRDRTMANWVAANVLTELQITGIWETDTRRGVETMGGSDWDWEARISTTDNPTLRRVDVRVFAAEDEPGRARTDRPGAERRSRNRSGDNPVSLLSGLLSEPLPEGFGSEQPGQFEDERGTGRDDQRDDPPQPDPQMDQPGDQPGDQMGDPMGDGDGQAGDENIGEMNEQDGAGF